eukprot:6207659-Pleurochrysis_carterae.AAC.1
MILRHAKGRVPREFLSSPEPEPPSSSTSSKGSGRGCGGGVVKNLRGKANELRTPKPTAKPSQKGKKGADRAVKRAANVRIIENDETSDSAASGGSRGN